MPKARPRLIESRHVCAAIVLLSVAVAAIIGLNLHHVHIREYEMDVALNGKAPWGDVGPATDAGSVPTVLYRKVGESYCYTAFQLPSLRDRLTRENKSHVTVEYNVFTTLGKERGYTLRSVDGIPLANGNQIFQKTQESGGQVLLAGDDSVHCP